MAYKLAVQREAATLPFNTGKPGAQLPPQQQHHQPEHQYRHQRGVSKRHKGPASMLNASRITLPAMHSGGELGGLCKHCAALCHSPLSVGVLIIWYLGSRLELARCIWSLSILYIMTFLDVSRRKHQSAYSLPSKLEQSLKATGLAMQSSQRLCSCISLYHSQEPGIYGVMECTSLCQFCSCGSTPLQVQAMSHCRGTRQARTLSVTCKTGYTFPFSWGQQSFNLHQTQQLHHTQQSLSV